MHLLGFVAMLLASSAPAGAEAGVVGRLVVKQRGMAVSMRQLRLGAGGPKLRFELRQGRDVLEAFVDDDGIFVARGAPGTYRVEYLVVLEGAEFITPREVTLTAGETGCVGSWTLTLKDAETDLGRNTFNELQVVDDCAALEPAVGKRAGAGALKATAVKTADVEKPERKLSVLELLVGLRAAGGYGTTGVQIGGEHVAGLLRDLDDSWFNVLTAVSVLVGLGTATASGEARLGIGAGVSMWIIEVQAGASLVLPRLGSPSAALWGLVRLGFYGGGVALRGDYTPGVAPFIAVTLDLSPVYVVGSLL